MNKFDLYIYETWGIRWRLYPLILNISKFPGLSNEKLADKTGISSIHVGNIVRILEDKKIIKNISLHSGRKAWEIAEENKIIIDYIISAIKERQK